MCLVAEDLGIITPEVNALRAKFKLPGMKILHFAFGGGDDNYYLPANIEANSVVYTGTHDNDTTRGWWQRAPARERAFAGAYLACHDGDAHWGMIRAASNSVARLALFPLQDVLGLDGAHRMNLPGTLGPANWSWRFTWPMLGRDTARTLGKIGRAHV